MPVEYSANMRRAGAIATCVAGLAFLLSSVGDLGLTSRAQAARLCENSGIPIWITIEKVRSSSGTIKVALYRGEVGRENHEGEEAAIRGKKVARTRVKARQGETTLCLNAPTEGDYSIALYHDENDNNKLDLNFMGIPREGFGFSNNPRVIVGIPEQEEMRFKVEALATALRISVVYLS